MVTELRNRRRNVKRYLGLFGAMRRPRRPTHRTGSTQHSEAIDFHFKLQCSCAAYAPFPNAFFVRSSTLGSLVTPLSLTFHVSVID